MRDPMFELFSFFRVTRQNERIDTVLANDGNTLYSSGG